MLFKEKTVLILGAGASIPYGFVSGPDLKKQIIEISHHELNSGNTAHLVQRKKMHASFEEVRIGDFHRALLRSVNQTIDAFLNDRPSFRDIGGYGIASVLMHFENVNKLFPANGWYARLFDELDLFNSERFCNLTSVITFNYDRSLECFLRECIVETKESQAREDALTRLANFPILHIHGSFGDYPEVAYASDPSEVVIKTAGERLALVFDDLDQSETVNQARKLLSQCSTAIFLGFGFDPYNLRRLGISAEDLKHVRFLGTTYRLPPDRLETASSILDKATILLSSTDCDKYFGEVLRKVLQSSE